jgi:hypothetical protein
MGLGNSGWESPEQADYNATSGILTNNDRALAPTSAIPTTEATPPIYRNSALGGTLNGAIPPLAQDPNSTGNTPPGDTRSSAISPTTQTSFTDSDLSKYGDKPVEDTDPNARNWVGPSGNDVWKGSTAAIPTATPQFMANNFSNTTTATVPNNFNPVTAPDLAKAEDTRVGYMGNLLSQLRKNVLNKEYKVK